MSLHKGLGLGFVQHYPYPKRFCTVCQREFEPAVKNQKSCASGECRREMARRWHRTKAAQQVAK